MMPSPMTTEVTIAGVSLKCRKEKRTIPMRKRGMERKKPPMAQVRVSEAFFRYLVVLHSRASVSCTESLTFYPDVKILQIAMDFMGNFNEAPPPRSN